MKSCTENLWSSMLIIIYTSTMEGNVMALLFVVAKVVFILYNSQSLNFYIKKIGPFYILVGQCVTMINENEAAWRDKNKYNYKE